MAVDVEIPQDKRVKGTRPGYALDVRTLNFETKIKLARDPRTPIKIMEALAEDKYDVRLALARNPFIPPSIMLKLIKGGNFEIQYSIVTNLRFLAKMGLLKEEDREKFKEVFSALSLSEHPSVRRGLVDNPVVPDELKVLVNKPPFSIS
ncbi:MAG: hypothetical protein QXR62_03520 [Candidatus Bathyarchaeia archaeon]